MKLQMIAGLGLAALALTGCPAPKKTTKTEAPKTGEMKSDAKTGEEAKTGEMKTGEEAAASQPAEKTGE